ncbi:hypothetical protein ATER59S_03212 [Aquamicrobium terrae]
MMTTESATFLDVRELIVATLGLEAERGEALKPWTPLFGGIPELDSLAVVTLAAALEQHFGFRIDDDEFTAEIFDTIGSLSDFVDRSRH